MIAVNRLALQGPSRPKFRVPTRRRKRSDIEPARLADRLADVWPTLIWHPLNRRGGSSEWIELVGGEILRYVPPSEVRAFVHALCRVELGGDGLVTSDLVDEVILFFQSDDYVQRVEWMAEKASRRKGVGE